jgi:hypothetical protein
MVITVTIDEMLSPDRIAKVQVGSDAFFSFGA